MMNSADAFDKSPLQWFSMFLSGLGGVFGVLAVIKEIEVGDLEVGDYILKEVSFLLSYMFYTLSVPLTWSASESYMRRRGDASGSRFQKNYAWFFYAVGIINDLGYKISKINCRYDTECSLSGFEENVNPIGWAIGYVILFVISITFMQRHTEAARTGDTDDGFNLDDESVWAVNKIMNIMSTLLALVAAICGILVWVFWPAMDSEEQKTQDIAYYLMYGLFAVAIPLMFSVAESFKYKNNSSGSIVSMIAAWVIYLLSVLLEMIFYFDEVDSNFTGEPTLKIDWEAWTRGQILMFVISWLLMKFHAYAAMVNVNVSEQEQQNQVEERAPDNYNNSNTIVTADIVREDQPGDNAYVPTAIIVESASPKKLDM